MLCYAFQRGGLTSAQGAPSELKMGLRGGTTLPNPEMVPWVGGWKGGAGAPGEAFGMQRPWKGKNHQPEARIVEKTAVVMAGKRGAPERCQSLPKSSLSRYEIISILIGQLGILNCLSCIMQN